MTFRWRVDDGPILTIFGYTNELEKSWTPSEKIFWIHAWSVFILPTVGKEFSQMSKYSENPDPVLKKVTRARSRWGAIANPHANTFDSPSTLQSHPWALPWQQNENSVQYVFYLLFVRTHTKFGIKVFEIEILMIFDLLPCPGSPV